MRKLIFLASVARERKTQRDFGILDESREAREVAVMLLMLHERERETNDTLELLGSMQSTIYVDG